MDWAHIHLLLNHFPIILEIMGAAAAIVAIVWPHRGTWMYAATSLTLAGVTVLPTYFTGEPAEHALNRPWYITRGTIHSHEDAAFISAILVGVVAMIAAVAWRRMVRYPREASLPGALRAMLLAGSMIASAHIVYTSLLGGRIVHDSPILQGPRPAGVPAPPPPRGSQGIGSGAMAPDTTATAPAATPQP
jgi:uncharacterized membrane protein